MVMNPNMEPAAARLDQIPANLMTKCPNCGTLLVTKDWLRDFKVCSRCGHHGRLGARERPAARGDHESEPDGAMAKLFEPHGSAFIAGFRERALDAALQQAEQFFVNGINFCAPLGEVFGIHEQSRRLNEEPRFENRAPIKA